MSAHERLDQGAVTVINLGEIREAALGSKDYGEGVAVGGMFIPVGHQKFPIMELECTEALDPAVRYSFAAGDVFVDDCAIDSTRMIGGMYVYTCSRYKIVIMI